MDQKDIDRVQAHLKRTFGNPHIAVKARPKQKDSAEVELRVNSSASSTKMRTKPARSCSRWLSWPKTWNSQALPHVPPHKGQGGFRLPHGVRMTTFILHGVRDIVVGRESVPRSTVLGPAHTPFLERS